MPIGRFCILARFIHNTKDLKIIPVKNRCLWSEFPPNANCLIKCHFKDILQASSRALLRESFIHNNNIFFTLQKLMPMKNRWLWTMSKRFR
jgi:hypothetical protein